MPARPSVYSCPIVEFEARYDRNARGGKFITPANAHLRAVRMLRMVAEAAHEMGKAGTELARIELVTEQNPGTCEVEMHVLLIPKWKLKAVVRISQPIDGEPVIKTL